MEVAEKLSSGGRCQIEKYLTRFENFLVAMNVTEDNITNNNENGDDFDFNLVR